MALSMVTPTSVESACYREVALVHVPSRLGEYRWWCGSPTVIPFDPQAPAHTVFSASNGPVPRFYRMLVAWQNNVYPYSLAYLWFA